MRLHTVRLPTPDLEASVGFYQALGLALSELEAAHARLTPRRGAILELAHAPVPMGAVAVLTGAAGALWDPDGNPLLQAPAPAPPLAIGQATVYAVLYPVRSVAASVRWYARVLGWPEQFTDARVPWSELAPAPRALGIVLSRISPNELRGALVLHVASLRHELARLKEHGLRPGWVRALPWSRLAGYTDPGGNPLILMERIGTG